MLTLFIELTNQLFWDGYAEQLSTEKPSLFGFMFDEFNNAHSQVSHRQLVVNTARRGVKAQLLRANLIDIYHMKN